MPYYRKKPIPVEARQSTGDNFQELQDWSNDLVTLSDYNEDVVCVHTLEGPVWGDKGDYIIKGVRGEFYLCQFERRPSGRARLPAPDALRHRSGLGPHPHPVRRRQATLP